MKLEELMIGDWVLHEGEPYQIRQLGIYGVDRDGEDYPAVCVGKPKGIGLIIERNEIKPIPLTAKILEKNGFVKQWNNNWQFNDYHTIIISEDFYIAIFELSIRLDYVHELQHALRLCGINKEITI